MAVEVNVDAFLDKASRTCRSRRWLYPFIRSSALLRHLDGRTRNVPVVLLYPGERRGPTGLRKPGATLFLVIDEVSQYILSHQDRVDRLRAFASALGATLRGGAWLLALGQQKLEEQADDSVLGWAKGRFPPSASLSRWVVERTHSRMNGYGKLRRCTERNARVMDFYLYLAAALVTIVTGLHCLWIGRQRSMTMDRQPSFVIVCVGHPPRSGRGGDVFLW